MTTASPCLRRFVAGSTAAQCKSLTGPRGLFAPLKQSNPSNPRICRPAVFPDFGVRAFAVGLLFSSLAALSPLQGQSTLGGNAADLPPEGQDSYSIGTSAGAPGRGPAAAAYALGTEVGIAQGFYVNTQDRETVRAFYNSVYQTPESIPSGWNGSTSGGIPGTNSAQYMEAIRQRVNWYRAMAGIPANITFNATYSSKAQQAALMMSRANLLSHTPPTSPNSTWPYATPDGSAAAAKSNLALGAKGPDALELYMRDAGTGNTGVGHRRWMLHPSIQEMGAGSVDAQGSYLSAQALWVDDGRTANAWTTVRDADASNGIGFTAWPPAGYVPYQQVYPRWTFNVDRIGGDTGSYVDNLTTVTMTKNGQSIGVTDIVRTSNWNRLVTIVFTPAGYDDAADVSYARPSQDDVYVVNVTGVMINSVRRNFSYTVRVFDPSVATPGATVPAITGPTQPYVNQASSYTHTQPSYAGSYQLLNGAASAYTATEGAESGPSLLTNGTFTALTAGGYDIVQGGTKDTSIPGTNAYAFRLSHNTGARETLRWNKLFVPGSGAALSLRSRLRYARTSERASVQISTNGGAGWMDLRDTGNAFPMVGIANGEVQTSFNTYNFSLANYVGRPVMLRFMYEVEGYGTYWKPDGGASGWFIDNISLSNTQELTGHGTSTISQAAGSFLFTPTSTAPRSLAVQSVGWTDYPLDYGTILGISPLNAPPVITILGTNIANGNLNIHFQVENLPASPSWKLMANSSPGGDYAQQNDATFQVIDATAKQYRYALPLGNEPTRFFRVEVQ